MGISKSELFNHYYPDELAKVLECLCGGLAERSEQVEVDSFFD